MRNDKNLEFFNESLLFKFVVLSKISIYENFMFQFTLVNKYIYTLSKQLLFSLKPMQTKK